MRARRMTIAAVAAIFVVAFALRWATLASLDGDDHASLWTATAFLKGDRPFRDVIDLGTPLYSGMSALAQAIAGYRVVGEVFLGTALVAFAFATAFHLAWRASGSVAVAAGLTVLGVLVATERGLYSYPKTFVYPLGLWLSWRYIDRPTLLRAVALAFSVAVAFGYRHDHGAYVGAGAAAAVLAAHWREGGRRIVYGWLRVGGALLLLVSPYLMLIQAQGGIVQYFQDRIQVFRGEDASSRRSVWFSVDSGAPAHWLSIDPPRRARVFVEWKPEITSATRLALEQQYSLTNGADPKKGLYEYVLTDVSRDNLAALVGDSRIVDRSGISVSYRDRADGSKAVEEVAATEAPPADAPPSARALVEIQWNSSLPEPERAALERQYGLLDYRSKWEYALADVSTDNIRAIVEDPWAFDTGLIDRDTYRPMEESWLVRVQRSIPLLRISIAPRYWHRYNAGIALHYLAYTLPYIMLVMLAAHRMRGLRGGHMTHAPEKMFAAVVMMAVAYFALLRREGYFADHAAATALLSACVVGQASNSMRLRRQPAARIVAGVVAGLVLVVSLFATLTYASSLESFANLPGVWEKSVRAFKAYSTSPPIDEYAPQGSTGDRGLIRYIYECTRPDDRIWILTDLYTFPYYAERRFVGHIYWSRDLLINNLEYQRKTIATVDKEEVPIILALGGRRPLQYLESYPLVHQYAARRYTSHYTVPEDNIQRGDLFWLSTDGRRKPAGTYERLGLPCFK